MIARPGEAAHVCVAVASDTLLRSRVAHFGRFLPRLGPFDYRTAFFCVPRWASRWCLREVSADTARAVHPVHQALAFKQSRTP